ncbi:glycolipid 2-alpha-mannosyltransferase-domain-containing protein [Polychytrium aggregatum]|uniref:glycolipid 2-alpha-mannosyltransferase-domain-containing protein n=1 Tax=Polychytrium aggregatum TaxID=110093 RepID=UPI0022FE8FAD|nr:glycolipid 2-alpha-mannosyltransferase-domain-containing protein [Polychytrium aggregatum]KAI9206929.1 glycolipid 2-alpha-mannosyltransferase-domain-containing protein [Polychytrium aggregatum]
MKGVKRLMTFALFSVLVLICAIELWIRNTRSSSADIVVQVFSDTGTVPFKTQPETLMIKHLSYQNVPGRENACIIMLARNSDKKNVVKTLATFESTFNARYMYPYVFFNQEPFDDDFKDAVSSATEAKVRFELIPQDQWSIPPNFNRSAVLESFRKQGERPGLKAELENYHHMCRYFSGFFATHPALRDFKYYWRLEPSVSYYCTLNYDPFELMRKQNKIYGFNIVGVEILWTVPTLWSSTLEYLHSRNRSFPLHLRAFDQRTGDEPESESRYNYKYFFNNFEIADLDFFRSDEYLDYFKFLDDKGGFFFERWGDAPVHTLGIALFLDPSQVHYFHDIGYRHEGYIHCPVDIPEDGVAYETCHCRDQMPKSDSIMRVSDSTWEDALKYYLRIVPELNLESYIG